MGSKNDRKKHTGGRCGGGHSSHRSYRPALGIDTALKEISHKKKGILYDSEVVDACLTLFNEKRFQLEIVQ